MILAPEGTQDLSEQKAIAFWTNEQQSRGADPDVPVVLIHASSVAEAMRKIGEEQTKSGPHGDIRRLAFHGHMSHGDRDEKDSAPAFVMGEVKKQHKWFRCQDVAGFFAGLRFDMKSNPEVMFLGCGGVAADIHGWKLVGATMNTWLDVRLLKAVAQRTRVKATASTHYTYASKDTSSGEISFGSEGLWVTYDPSKADPDTPLSPYSYAVGNLFKRPSFAYWFNLYLSHAGPAGETLPVSLDPAKVPKSPYSY